MKDRSNIDTENNLLRHLAHEVGTPLYVYDARIFLERWRTYDAALSHYPQHQICYSVKANTNLEVLRMLAQEGSGFDIVSGGELQAVLHVGALPERIVFSGVGKTNQELQQALKAGIGCFNVESASELWRLSRMAEKQGCVAPFSLRINPDIDAKTHPYISTGLAENKFGIPLEEALALYHQAQAHAHLSIKGVALHIGSQLIDLSAFQAQNQFVLTLLETLNEQGITLEQVDFGGGLGVVVGGDHPPSIEAAIKTLTHGLPTHYGVVVEPGRSIIAEAGVLLTEVITLKQNGKHHFAVVDAAMNDLMRPALYEAYHPIRVIEAPKEAEHNNYHIVGPICETADFLGKNRPLALAEGALLSIEDAGAYGFSMASTYNSRALAAEVLIKEDGSTQLVRPRQSQEQLLGIVREDR